MARRPKKKKDTIRPSDARARKRGHAAPQSSPAPIGSSSTSFAPANVRVDADEWARRTQEILPFRTALRFWMTGEYEQADATFREMLERDHDDPRCIRYWLASCLFHSGSSDELGKLLQRHDDNSGIWRFAQALHAFREHGDTNDAQRMLQPRFAGAAVHVAKGKERTLRADDSFHFLAWIEWNGANRAAFAVGDVIACWSSGRRAGDEIALHVPVPPPHPPRRGGSGVREPGPDRDGRPGDEGRQGGYRSEGAAACRNSRGAKS